MMSAVSLWESSESHEEHKRLVDGLIVNFFRSMWEKSGIKLLSANSSWIHPQPPTKFPQLSQMILTVDSIGRAIEQRQFGTSGALWQEFAEPRRIFREVIAERPLSA